MKLAKVTISRFGRQNRSGNGRSDIFYVEGLKKMRIIIFFDYRTLHF